MRWFAVLLALLAPAFACPARAACALSRLAELPVTMNGLQPTIPAKINGSDVRFIADSGAFFSVISPASAAELKLPLSAAPFGFYMVGIGGSADVSIATVKQFGLAGAVFPRAEFIVGGSDVAAPSVGVLGQNVLRLADVEYDFAGGAIRLMRPQGCERAVLAYWAAGKPYSRFPLELTSLTEPFARGTALVNGVRIRVVFDTGAQTSILNLAAARRAGIRTDGPGVQPAGVSSGFGRGWVRTWIAPVASFQVGDEQIKNTRLRVGNIGLDVADMLIGADFFLSHRVYVANSQHALYFTYNGGPVFNLSQVPQAEPAATPDAAPSTSVASAEPSDADGFSRRGAALAARRDYERAVKDFSKAVELAPAEPGYLYERARARMSLDQPDQALADLNAAVKLKPQDAQGRLERAMLRFKQEDKAGAQADLDAADAAAPKQADLRLQIGELYVALDQFDAAVAQFDLWIAVHGEDSRLPAGLNSRCWASGLAGRSLDKALSDCNAAVRLTRQAPDVLDSRGLVHLRRGEFDRAIADYNAALARKPELAWSLYGRGVAEIRTGAKAQGQADIAAAAALQPKLAERAARLGLAP